MADRSSEIAYCKQLIAAGRPVPEALAHAEKIARREYAREENRRRYPKAAAAIDEVRKYFPDAEVVSLGKV